MGLLDGCAYVGLVLRVWESDDVVDLEVRVVGDVAHLTTSLNQPSDLPLTFGAQTQRGLKRHKSATGKLLANSWQTPDRRLADSKQTPGRHLADTWQSDWQSDWQTPGRATGRATFVYYPMRDSNANAPPPTPLTPFAR